MRIAQLSDMHFVAKGERLYDCIDINAQNAEIIHQINQLKEPVDAVVISGDLCNDGSEAQYETAANILKYLHCPLYVINGNHDHQPHFVKHLRELCPPLQSSANVCYAVEMGGWQLLFIDSTVDGQTHGAIDDAQLQWVEQQLAKSRSPVALFMHHPPLSMHSAHMDPINCRNGDQLLAFAERYPVFQGIYCGHNHCFSVTRYQQLIIACAPATSVQIPVYQHDSTPYYQHSTPSCLIHSLNGPAPWVSFQHSFELY